MRKGYSIFITLFLGIILVAAIVPSDTFAIHGDQIVPQCPTQNGVKNVCTLCNFYKLLQNIMKFAVWHIAPLAATVMFAWGGILMLMPYFGGGSAVLEKGKKILLTTLIGLLIVFLSWVIVNTIISTLAAGNFAKAIQSGAWYNITCPAPA